MAILDGDGMCPAPMTRKFAGNNITFACELGIDHSGDHQAAGLRWKLDDD